jgi:MFS family permease
MGIVSMFMAGAGMGFYFILPLYLVKELGIPLNTANTILGLSRLGDIAVGLATGFVLDRFSAKKTMFFLTLSTGILTMFATTTRDVAWLGVFLFAQGSLIMGFFPVLFFSASKLFEEEIRSRATGALLSLGAMMGNGIIPYLLGLSGDTLSFRIGILVLGAVTALTSGLVLVLLLRKLE